MKIQRLFEENYKKLSLQTIIDAIELEKVFAFSVSISDYNKLDCGLRLVCKTKSEPVMLGRQILIREKGDFEVILKEYCLDCRQAIK
jgi:hypothetical protein